MRNENVLSIIVFHFIYYIAGKTKYYPAKNQLVKTTLCCLVIAC